MTATTRRGTFYVRGIRVRSASVRRYICVVVRPEPVTATDYYGDERVYPAFARVERRSDSYETARAFAYRYGRQSTGCFCVVVDTTTGEEV